MVDTAKPATEDLMNGNEYAPLYEHPLNLEPDVWSTTFEEVEIVLGFALPPAARTDLVWWFNRVDTHSTSHALAWSLAGWFTSNIDVKGETIKFERDDDYRIKINGKPRRSITEEWVPHDFGPWPEGLVIDREFMYGDDWD